MSVPDHRKPPLPEWCQYPTQGVCRWCGHLIWKDAENINKRRLWHSEKTHNCLAEYFIVTSPRSARIAVQRRDKGRCSCCGKVKAKWQADHIVRLADVPREIKYWQLENLQTLCEDCHLKKTIEENRMNGQ